LLSVAARPKAARSLPRPRLPRGFVAEPLLPGAVAQRLGNLHRTEMRPAHRTEMRELMRFLGQRRIVILACPLRIEAQIELVLPAELEARLRQRVVADLRD